jgi:hypothetical protein
MDQKENHHHLDFSICPLVLLMTEFFYSNKHKQKIVYVSMNNNNNTRTRTSTLYFKSSGDGKTDGSLLGNGLVINRSVFKKPVICIIK